MTVSIPPEPTKADPPNGRLGQYAADGSRIGYEDVLAALRAAGFRHVAMIGSGGIDVICVHLTDRTSDGPELLIGQRSTDDLLALPAREDLPGWAIVFRPSCEPEDDVIVYTGSPDALAMVRAATKFATANGFRLAPGRP